MNFITIHASDEDQPEPWDNSKVDLRIPDQDTIDYYKSLQVYQFEQEKKPESLWDKFMRWLSELFANSDSEINWVNVTLISLAVITFTIIVVFLSGVRIRGIFALSRNVKSADIGFTAHTDDIHDTKLDELLRTYIESQTWREATRILYLIFLRELHDKTIIKWDIYKTNRDYFYEIESDQLKQDFHQIVIHYEYVWYGQFQINENTFNLMQNRVNSTISNLKNAG